MTGKFGGIKKLLKNLERWRVFGGCGGEICAMCTEKQVGISGKYTKLIKSMKKTVQKNKVQKK